MEYQNFLNSIENTEYKNKIVSGDIMIIQCLSFYIMNGCCIKHYNLMHDSKNSFSYPYARIWLNGQISQKKSNISEDGIFEENRL